ncbi:SNF2 family N-terminal domain-containing protein, putative, partial [Eimeria acervulina]
MSPSPSLGDSLSYRDSIVAAACCVSNKVAGLLPLFALDEDQGPPNPQGGPPLPSETFTRSFLRLQQQFRTRAEQMLKQKQQQQQQQEAAAAAAAGSSSSTWAKPLYAPSHVSLSQHLDEETVKGGDMQEDLNIDGVISALLERSGAAAGAAAATGAAAAAPPAAAGAAAETGAAAATGAAAGAAAKEKEDLTQFADLEPLSNEQLLQQLRLQLQATKYLQQGLLPPAELMREVAACMPRKVREEMLSRPSVMLQVSRQLNASSRTAVLEQLEDRKRLLDCVLSEDPKVRERFQHICSLPDHVRRQAKLERRLCSLSAFQQCLRSSILQEARKQSLPLADLLLEPQPSRVQQASAARAALFAALDPLGVADPEAPELVQKAQKARTVAASAVRAVFSPANLRCCLYTPRERREQQRQVNWERIVQQQSGCLQRHWRRQREAAAALAADAASQVAQMEQVKLAIREKEQKERMRLLKENDIEAYTKLVQQTKNERLQELLRATEEFLESLGRKVQIQKMETDRLQAQSQLGGKGGESSSESAAGAKTSGEEEKKRDSYYTLSHAVREEVQQPQSLIGGTLMPYQMAGLQWMLSLYNNNLHGILADEMGLGKTIQTIALLAYLKEFKNNAGPHLIIVPLSTLSNWADELQRWAPSLKVMIFKGARLERRQLQRQLKQIDFNVCLTTFDLAIRERNALATPSWRGFSALCGGDKAWGWFSQPFEVHGMSPDRSQETANGGSSLLNEEEQLLVIHRLHAVLRPFLLRRIKKDVLKDMPEKKEYLVHIPLTEWQRL